MAELLARLQSISTLLFAVVSMLALGFRYSLGEIIEPLRKVGDVLRALVANFVLVPLLAYVVAQLLSLQRPFEIGLMLTASAAGAPFLIKLTVIAKANVVLSATLLVLLLPVTVVYMPLVVPWALPEVYVNPGRIAAPLVLTMLAPLGVGLLVKARWPHLAAAPLPLLGKLSTAALVVLVATTFVLNFEYLPGLFGERAIPAALLVSAGAFGIGYLLGGPDPAKRDVLGLGTAQRNIAAATVVATQSFEDRNIVTMVVVTCLLAWLILFPLARAIRVREMNRSGMEDA